MKLFNVFAAAAGLTVLLTGCSSTDSAGQGRSNVARTPAHEAGMADNWYGTGKTVQFAGAPAEKPAKKAAVHHHVAETPAPARAPLDTACSTPTTHPARMSLAMPPETTLGETFMYEISVAADQCLGNVLITDSIPAGASFVKSEPPGQVAGNKISWNLGDMDKGASSTIKVWLKAEKEGTLASCATISADPRVCGQTFVGRAALALTKTGPETAVLGQDIAYNVVVSNTGSAVAKNVVLTDTLPAGLVSPSGQSTLKFEVGDLAPNQSKTVSVPVKAAQRGKHCNVVAASSTNAGEARAEACTTVLQPGLKIVKTGTKEQFLTRTAKYNIVVSNTGDTDLTGVVVTDNAPSATSIVAAPGATVSGNNATWNVGTLPAGQNKSFEITLTSSTAGNHCNGASVATAQGLRESAEACTLWSGIGAILLEVVDDPDPIRIDEETTYTIRVTNQGTANLNNIKTAAEFDSENAPVTTSAGTISGQGVTFPNVPVLAPKQSFTYTVKVKGTNAGDARNRVSIVCDEITRPVVEEESTRVY